MKSSCINPKIEFIYKKTFCKIQKYFYIQKTFDFDNFHQKNFVNQQQHNQHQHHLIPLSINHSDEITI